MKLIKLSLENFQGLKKEEFNFGGKNATIYGDNATGKTTVFNSLTWLLSGRPSTGAKNYTPKTKGPDGDMHYLDHSAEATLELEDGRIITLKKTFKEVYKKKRGSSTEEFSGHTTDHFIDGVPATEREYNEAALAISGGDLEKMKMLTMPDYFPEEMSWQDRREILLEMTQDVTDEDVINSNKDLKDLKNYLLMPGTTDQHYTVDEYKKIAGAQKTKINKELQGIPDRIDEAERAIPDIEGIDAEKIDKEVAELRKDQEALQLEKTQALSGDLADVARRNQISELNTQLAEARANHITKYSQLNESTYAAIAQLKQEQMEAKKGTQDKELEKQRLEENKKRMEKHRQKLMADYKKVQAEAWDEEKEECPTCKRALPEEEIEELKNDYNLKKSARLQKINQEGLEEASKDMIADLQAKAAALEKEIAAAKEKEASYDEQIAALEKQIQTPPTFEESEDFTKISAEISKLKAAETDTEEQQDQIHQQYAAKALEITTKIRELEQSKSKLHIAASQQARIEELSRAEEKLAREYEAIEQGIHLCELFIKTKVDLVTASINDKFESVTFRLFKEQQNGGIKEDCEVMIPSEGGRLVDYAFANNAARINAGLEIIGALAEHWETSMPVFVDNAESVTKLKELEGIQIIRLEVSEPDKKLRLEVKTE